MQDSLFSMSLDGVNAHLLYFGLSIVAVAIFVAIYILITPYHEFKLIREGNTAAAISLGGAILGYTIPLAKAVAQSEGIGDMMVWAGVALLAQVVGYFITRLLVPHLPAQVNERNTAAGVLLAAIAVAIGLLNAAAMTA